MKLVFNDESFSYELLRAVGYSSYGGADIGECLETAARIQEGDFVGWHRAWKQTADRISAIGERALQGGHRVSARDAFLRASNYYRTGEFYLHGLDNAAALESSRLARSKFEQAIALMPHRSTKLAIPYEGTTLPGYLFQPAADRGPRPTLLICTGFDGTQEELYMNVAQAAMDRGYNLLTFEGPGQGAVIREQRLYFRHDWEKVVTPVIDFALTRPEIDAGRLALLGVSYGGYFAARAAAFDHRLAALLVVDGLYDLYGAAVTMMVPAEARGLLTQLDAAQAPELDAFMERLKNAATGARWALNHGPWAFGVGSAREFVARLRSYTLKEVSGQIRCPTLVCEAENDQFFRGQPEEIFEALTCHKTYARFTAEDAAEEHCHVGAARLMNQRLFDWLDDVLKARDQYQSGSRSPETRSLDLAMS
jgi:dienelactone hydrolase